MVQSEKFLDKKAHIIQSAFALFSKNGIRDTTVDEVAKYAGVSKKTIYMTFRSKDNLVREAFAWKMGGLAGSVDQLIESDLPALEKMVKYIEVICSQISDISLKTFADLNSYSVFSQNASSEYLKRAVFIRFNRMLEQAKAENHIGEGVDIGATLMTYWNMLSPFLLMETAKEATDVLNKNITLSQILTQRLIQLYREILVTKSMSMLETQVSQKSSFCQ